MQAARYNLEVTTTAKLIYCYMAFTFAWFRIIDHTLSPCVLVPPLSSCPCRRRRCTAAFPRWSLSSRGGGFMSPGRDTLVVCPLSCRSLLNDVWRSLLNDVCRSFPNDVCRSLLTWWSPDGRDTLVGCSLPCRSFRNDVWRSLLMMSGGHCWMMSGGHCSMMSAGHCWQDVCRSLLNDVCRSLLTWWSPLSNKQVWFYRSPVIFFLQQFLPRYHQTLIQCWFSDGRRRWY